MKPEAFLAIERTMAATMHAEMDKVARRLIAKLEPLLIGEKWQDAHEVVNKLSLNGVVEDQRKRLEEVAVSALIFGAQHLHDHPKKTSFARGKKPLPHEIQNALDQLTETVESDGADYLRNQLHKFIRERELADEKAPLAKDDLSEDQLAETGGLQEPEQGGKKKKARTAKSTDRTLYVNRPLINGSDIHAWMITQGLKNAMQLDELHVTICYSKEPLEWPEKNAPDRVKTGDDTSRTLEQFGEATVLTLSSGELSNEHDYFVENGASYDFPTYRPHITITYDLEGADLDTVEPYQGPLIFGPQEWAEITKGWADDLEETRIRKAADMGLAAALNAAVLTGAKMPVDIGAHMTTSRLVKLGFLAEAVDKGVEGYQVTEVLDGKTCPFCRYMHGKIFKTQPEYDRTIQSLSTSDPADLKATNPWPSTDKASMRRVYGMTADELQGEGLGGPPYHPFCRGMLVPIGTVDDEEFPFGSMGGDDDEGGGLGDLFGAAETDEEVAAAEAVDAESEKAVEHETVDEMEAKLGEMPDGDLKEKLGQIEDPDLLERAMDAYDKDDLEEMHDILVEAGVISDDYDLQKDDDEDPDFRPNTDRKGKRKKPQTPAGLEQDTSDLASDSSNVAFDNGEPSGPLDRD